MLDETDSGLDIDAIRIVSEGANALRSKERAMLVITHYQRLLNYIVPDKVHVLTGAAKDELSRRIRAAVDIPLGYLGGARSLANAEQAMAEGFDAVVMARPWSASSGTLYLPPSSVR